MERQPSVRMQVALLCVFCAGALCAESFPKALFAELYSPERNTVFSPYCITAVLAMAGAGARGDTATQIGSVLGDTPEAIAQNLHALQKGVAEGSPQSATLRMINALFPQQGYALLPDYIECAKSRFNGNAIPVDYANNLEAAAATGGGGTFGFPPKIFLANRPFAFAIRACDSGAILFLGVVNDPSANPLGNL
ncbi:MAG: hypothetical protein FWG50_04635 [Kiritimatiellaeota bacterium]|nr:hypothetical protein [Kiritimatiellota bacterium]